MKNKKGNRSPSAIPMERITQIILLIRGHKVILDADLAKLYGATTNRLLKKSFSFSLREKTRMRGILKSNADESKIALTPALSRGERGLFSNLLNEWQSA